MTLLPTTILRVILIGVPPSTWWPTSPSQTITFSTVLPSILKTVWYPACLLELPKEPQSTVNLSRPLYPTFVVYLTTIGGRLSFTHRSEMDKSYVKERFRNLLYKLRMVRFCGSVFLICFTKILRIFDPSIPFNKKIKLFWWNYKYILVDQKSLTKVDIL